MRKLLLIISTLVCGCLFGQNIETIKGEFEISETLNNFTNLKKKEKKEFIETINKIDTNKINKYFELLFGTDSKDGLNFKQAEALKLTDSTLKNEDEREISALYNAYFLNQHKLLDYCFITFVDNITIGTKNVILNKKQFRKIKKSVGKEINLTVQFITEINLTKFRVYKLIEE